MSDSHCIGKEPCPKCGSRDNLARYSDGHAHCFSMGCDYFERGEGDDAAPSSTHRKGHSMASMELLSGEAEALDKRGITLETCEKFNYVVGTEGEKKVHIANYYDPDGKRVVAQKVRDRNKGFRVTGSLKDAGLYGQWLWRDRGKRVVIVEGEIDCLTVSQLQGNKWPVVSIPTGAKGAAKALTEQLEWLLGFDEVVLFFDNDDAGKAATEECAPLFPPGKVKIARMSEHKDANEALLALEGDKVINAIWEAKEFRPDGIVSMADVREAALLPPQRGLDWPWPAMTKMTHGRRRCEVYAFGAGTGIGKTDVFTQVIAHILETEVSPVAAFYFEQPTPETVKRVAGKIAHHRFHVPDAGWRQEELLATVDKMVKDDRLFLYDHFGACDWDVVETHIRYLAVAKGVKDFFIDHLTALADSGDNERGSLEDIMKRMAQVAQSLGVTIYLISHLATPEGKPHEEGGRVTIRHFKGSRAIGFWSHFMFGLERDQQHESEEWRTTTTVRCLKDRHTGQGTGSVFYLGYDVETGVLHEKAAPRDHGFADETPGQPAEPF